MTEPLPWRSDVTLDAARVARIVNAQFPALAPARAVFLADGWDTESWRVNEAWVVKFPKRASMERAQESERAALPWLAPRLPLPVPVPTLLGEPGPEFPFRFWGHEYLPGVAADRADPSAIDRSACAAGMADFLSALHAVPVEATAGWRLPEGLPLVPRSARQREWERWAAVKAVAPAPLAARMEAWLAADDPPLAPGKPVVTHGDLRDGNVLLDAAGAPAAVIDWIDLSVIDPAKDFGGLLAWLGEPFLLDVLARYRHPIDDEVVVRSRRRAMHLALAVAWQGVLQSRPHLMASGFRGLDYALPR